MSWSLDFGSALGAVAGGIFANASSSKQYKYQSALQRQAAELNYKYGLMSAENMPSSTRKGLESAGYNPMLAVQNGTSGANASFTTTGQVSAPDYAGGVASGIGNAINIQGMKNQTSQTESINDKNYAEADEAKVRKQTLLEKLPFISKREKAEIGNVEKDTLMKESQIHNLEETTRFIEKDYELRKKLGLMGIDVQRYGYDTAYNASTYASNVSKGNNMRDNRIKTTIEHIKHPYGSLFHKGYTSGKSYQSYQSYKNPWKN